METKTKQINSKRIISYKHGSTVYGKVKKPPKCHKCKQVAESTGQHWIIYLLWIHSPNEEDKKNFINTCCE